LPDLSAPLAIDFPEFPFTSVDGRFRLVALPHSGLPQAEHHRHAAALLATTTPAA
jgi:hypothetical protein